MTMQQGSLTTKSRLEGPNVWQFRWSEKGPNGKRIYRKRVIGTIEEYPNQDAARSAVASLITEVNWANLRSTSHRSSNVDELIGEVDVAPFQGEQFALA